MNAKDAAKFKTQLEKEKTLLEAELATVGRVSSKHPNEWEATSGNIEVDSADDNEVADKMEELDENILILEQLRKQLYEVNAALERIQNGTYGICEVSGEIIEPERLEANPSARTSMKHMN